MAPSFELELASPRGFCAGVDRAIEIVERALDLYGAPVYVRHEIVHNRHVVEGLRAKGAIFTDELCDVPEGSLVFFNPHTVHGSEENRSERRRRALVLTYQPAGHRMFKVDAVREVGSRD